MCDTHRVHINHSHTWAPWACADTAWGAARPDFCYLCPSFSATLVLTAQYLSCCRVAKQHTAPCSESLAVKARHAVGQRGQSWGWEKVASAGVVLLHHTLACSHSSVPSISRHMATPSDVAGLENDAADLCILESSRLISHVRERSWGWVSQHSPSWSQVMEWSTDRGFWCV